MDRPETYPEPLHPNPPPTARAPDNLTRCMRDVCTTLPCPPRCQAAKGSRVRASARRRTSRAREGPNFDPSRASKGRPGQDCNKKRRTRWKPVFSNTWARDWDVSGKSWACSRSEQWLPTRGFASEVLSNDDEQTDVFEAGFAVQKPFPPFLQHSPLPTPTNRLGGWHILGGNCIATSQTSIEGRR